MEKIYSFWSINTYKSFEGWVWLCIPPDEKYIPSWYPKGAVVGKHKEKILPPLSYWLDPEYEKIVYQSALTVENK